MHWRICPPTSTSTPTAATSSAAPSWAERVAPRTGRAGPGGVGGGGGGGGGGLTQANGSAEKTALARAQKGGGAPIHIGGQTVTPGGSRFTAADVRNALPAPLLVVLVMLGAGALVAGGATARNRVGRRKG